MIGHAPPRRLNETSESIGARLLALADNLGLRAAADRVPHIGRRLLIRHGVVACDYGHDDYLMRVPDTGQAWQQHVIRGGQVLLVVGLDPLPPYQGQQEVDAYLRQATNRHHVLMGATGAR
ncbi:MULTISPECIES: hypothetical protein [unclassified Streptomyces]|uniref:hypothetical protein n=1 Tax=unclassified Streptomyces TaxID=2593676 RepID=UPI00114CC7D4|nr:MULTISPECIES: hypothetical protein [unclassified Streptomyces]MYZ33777.1 hypothetical protein [Streptomyces sp. SID4917]